MFLINCTPFSLAFEISIDVISLWSTRIFFLLFAIFTALQSLSKCALKTRLEQQLTTLFFYMYIWYVCAMPIPFNCNFSK